MRETGIPRSTYQRLRRKLYADGWLRDRYVPRLDVVGARSLTFVLGSPYAEQTDGVEQAWSRARNAVVVWATPEFYFAVFVGEDPTRSAHDRRLFPRSFRSIVSLTIRPGEGEIPRYFDYAPAFAHLVGLPPPPGNGGGWQILPPEGDRPALASTSRSFRAARELVGRAGAAERGRRLPHLQGYTFLPRAAQEAIRRGLVRWQVTPDYRRIPGVDGRRPSDLVFVYAERRPGRDAETLLTDLAREAEAFPFLAAFDRDHALLGLLEMGSDPEEREGRPVPPLGVLVTALGRSLVGVELFRERLAFCRGVVDHDYARVLG